MIFEYLFAAKTTRKPSFTRLIKRFHSTKILRKKRFVSAVFVRFCLNICSNFFFWKSFNKRNIWFGSRNWQDFSWQYLSWQDFLCYRFSIFFWSFTHCLQDILSIFNKICFWWDFWVVIEITSWWKLDIKAILFKSVHFQKSVNILFEYFKLISWSFW